MFKKNEKSKDIKTEMLGNNGLGIYTLKDEVSETLNKPFFAPNDKVAKRSIIDAQKSQPGLNTNANDYELYKLGTINLMTGEVIAEIKLVYKLVQLKEEKEQENE